MARVDKTGQQAAPADQAALEVEARLREAPSLEAIRSVIFEHTQEASVLNEPLEALAVRLAKSPDLERAALALVAAVSVTELDEGEGEGEGEGEAAPLPYTRAHKAAGVDLALDGSDRIVQLLCHVGLNGLMIRDVIIDPEEIIGHLMISELTPDEARAALTRGARLNHAWSKSPNKVL